MDLNAYKNIFNDLPVVSEEYFLEQDIELPNRRAYAFRYEKHVSDSLTPKLNKMITKAIVEGTGKHIVSVGGDICEKDIFFFMPHDIGKKRETKVSVFDIRKQVPEEFVKNAKKYNKVKFSYTTNFDFEAQSIPKHLSKDTRYCVTRAVFDYLIPEIVHKRIREIKEDLQPDYYLLVLWLSSPDVDPKTNSLVRREAQEIAHLLTTTGLTQVKNASSPITYEEMTQNSTFLLNWTPEQKENYNLTLDYPGTSLYPIPIIRFFKDMYNLEHFCAYRVDNSQYPREAFMFFKKKSRT